MGYDGCGAVWRELRRREQEEGWKENKEEEDEKYDKEKIHSNFTSLYFFFLIFGTIQVESDHRSKFTASIVSYR